MDKGLTSSNDFKISVSTLDRMAKKNNKKVKI